MFLGQWLEMGKVVSAGPGPRPNFFFWPGPKFFFRRDRDQKWLVPLMSTSEAKKIRKEFRARRQKLRLFYYIFQPSIDIHQKIKFQIENWFSSKYQRISRKFIKMIITLEKQVITRILLMSLSSTHSRMTFNTWLCFLVRFKRWYMST